MAYSLVQYLGDGTTTAFQVTFPYLRREHITVTVGGVGASFTWVNDANVQVSPAPPSGVPIIVGRNSSRGARLVDFQNGSVLTEADLDLATTQNLYVAQEAFDASLYGVAQNDTSDAAQAAIAAATSAASSAGSAQVFALAASAAAAALAAPGNAGWVLRGDGTYTNTITGPLRFETALSGDVAAYALTGAATDEKLWSWRASLPGTFGLYAYNDAGAPGTNSLALGVTRTGRDVITTTLGGRVLLGGATDDTTSKLQVSGTTKLQHLTVSGSAPFVRSTSLAQFMVTEYGAVGDGTTDDTTALQAAITAMQGVNGATLQFPSGKTFRITAPLTIVAANHIIAGNGSTITLDDPTGTLNGITIGNGSLVTVSNITLRDLVLQRAQVATGGSLLHVSVASGVVLENVTFYGALKAFKGATFTRAFQVWMTSCRFYGMRSHGVDLFGTGVGADSTTDFRMTDCVVQDSLPGSTANGLNIGQYVQGLYIRGTVFYNLAGWGVVCNGNSTAGANSSYKFQHCDFDTCVAGGAYIENATNGQITGSWFSGATGPSLVLHPGTGGWVVSDNQFYTPATSTVVEVWGTDYVIQGNLMNSGDIAVCAKPGSTVITITGNHIRYMTSRGIDLTGTPAPDGVTIVGNTIHQSGTGIAPGTATNVVTSANNIF